jgi:hypothetical protein
VLAGKTIPLEVTLSRLAVTLTPVLITGRAELTGWRAGFYQRKDVGAGRYFTREDIEKRNPSLMSDMFRMIPGVTIVPSQGIIRNQLRFRGARTGCAPLTFLDGAPLSSGEFDIDALSPRSIEAFEVYTGTIVPPRFAVAPGIGPRTCGAIVIWSREGERRAKRPSPNAKSTASELVKLVDDRQIFTAAQVDVTARQDSAHPVKPMYPDALFDAQVSGSVMVEFIVTSSGEVDLDRISVVFATHPGFIDPVRARSKMPCTSRRFVAATLCTRWSSTNSSSCLTPRPGDDAESAALLGLGELNNSAQFSFRYRPRDGNAHRVVALVDIDRRPGDA